MTAPSRPPSRRQMLLMLGAVSVGAVVCGAGGGLVLLNWMNRPDATQEAVIPVTDDPNAPAIVPRTAWGALSPDHNARNERGFASDDNPTGWLVYSGDLRDIYKTIVIHHSVITAPDDLRTLAEIQTLHRGDRGWADVAYHYFIGYEGTIYAGRDINARGAHVGGFNTGSLGICLFGNFEETQPTPPQMRSAQTLVNYLTEKYAMTHLAGHGEFNPETHCPGSNLQERLDELAETAGLIRGTDGYEPPV